MEWSSWARKSCWKGSLSTVYLLILTSLDQLLLSIENVIYLFSKYNTLMRRPTVQSRPLQLEFPVISNPIIKYVHEKMEGAKRLKKWDFKICGLYYKHFTIVNDTSRVVTEWCHDLEHNSRVISYVPFFEASLSLVYDVYGINKKQSNTVIVAVHVTCNSGILRQENSNGKQSTVNKSLDGSMYPG